MNIPLAIPEAQEESEARLVAAGRLAPGLIHELRHPLTGIKAGLKLVEQAAGAAVEGEEWELVLGQVARLEELLATYQDFLDSDRLQTESLALGSVVSGALQLVAYRTRRMGDAFRVSLPEPPVVVRTSRAAVTHALVNLLVNALDALEAVGGISGGRRLSVRLLGPSGASGGQVRISDEGPGIPPQLVERIFDPNFSTKPRGKGMGLGLSIARRMLTSAGASLRLVDASEGLREPWSRTEFCIDFPRMAPPASRIELEDARPQQKPAGRLLVIDDEEVILKLARIGLTRHGFDVVTAINAEVALEALDRLPFDAILTDKNLPGINGVDLAIRARVFAPHAAIFLITAYATRESATTLLRADIDDYFSKPFELDFLARRISSGIARRRRLASLGPTTAPSTQARVILTLDNATVRGRLARLLIRLKHTVVIEDAPLPLLTGKPPYDGLVIDASRLSVPLRESLWKLQEELPTLKVFVLADPDSMMSSIAAISVGAAETFVPTVSDEVAEKAFRRVWGRP